MKKRFLIIFTVLVLVVAFAAPAFAAGTDSTEDPLCGTWVFNSHLTFPSDTLSVDLSFTCNGTDYNHLTVWSGSSKVTYSLITGDDIDVYKGAVGVPASWVNSAYRTITINSKLSSVQNGDKLLAWMQSVATKQVPPTEPPPPPPVYASVPDAVTGDLPGYLEIIGSILASLFTPSGDLFQLGIVIAVCFGGAVVYGGIRLFRKLTPGV